MGIKCMIVCMYIDTPIYQIIQCSSIIIMFQSRNVDHVSGTHLSVPV